MMNALNDKLAGQCTCGNVQFELTKKPLFVHCCHCSWCQRESGTAFALNALIESDSVKLISGDIEQTHLTTNSGYGQILNRCSECKVVLWSYYGGAKEQVSFVRVGTLVNPNHCPPDIHIYTSSKLDWVKLDDRVPVMEEYYQRSKYWPEESVLRYKKALNKE